MADIRHALIIGGGIAGPAAALALHKAGIASTVLESHERGADGVGGVLSLAPNGLDALRVLGLGSAAAALGEPITRMVMADGQGRRFGEFGGLPGLPPSRLLWRAELHRVLHERATALGIRIEHGKRLTGVVETPSGIVARFADASVRSADVLIGADGIHSTVRRLIDAQAPAPRYTGLLGFGGWVQASHESWGRPGAMHFVYGRRAFLGHWSGPDGRTLWFGNLPRAVPLTMAEARAVPATDWLRLLREVYADDRPGRELLAGTSPEQLLVAGAGEMMPPLPRWHRQRMVLVGDAAHAPSSSSGQGASLALESALELARCLRDLPDPPTAFAAYEELRRPRVERVAADAARTNQRKASGPLGRAVMRVLMPLAMKTWFKPEAMFGALHRHRIDWDGAVGA